jgi:hypothetical protein
MWGYIVLWLRGEGGPTDVTDDPDESRLWNLWSWKFFGSALRYPPGLLYPSFHPPTRADWASMGGCVVGVGVGLDFWMRTVGLCDCDVADCIKDRKM